MTGGGRKVVCGRGGRRVMIKNVKVGGDSTGVRGGGGKVEQFPAAAVAAA